MINHRTVAVSISFTSIILFTIYHLNMTNTLSFLAESSLYSQKLKTVDKI